MDRPTGIERGLALPECPGASLLVADGEERDQAESVGELPRHLVERRGAVAELRRLLVGEIRKFRLELEVDAGGPVDERDEQAWS